MVLVIRCWAYATLVALTSLWVRPVLGQTPVGNATTTGISRSLNPAISLNALISGTAVHNPFVLEESEEAHDEQGEEGDKHREDLKSGFDIQEIEMRFTAFVDPFARGDITLAIEGTDQIEVEEGYVVAQTLPRGLSLRAGKFFLPFGKHNRLRTHRFPFINTPGPPCPLR